MTDRTPPAEKPEGLVFPCQYPVKVMSEAGAKKTILALVERHVEFCADRDVRTRPSRNGRFEAITVTVEARSREQLEGLYADLRELDVVKMML
ncbi:MAG: DUF493 domain-containing protein [Wenzhouxiangella sp.]|jgi:putative lipoic acid-binding regulatory protein|nr:DUF493 domain-containing protein [Wenzhouxiangella sp.]